MPLFFFHLRTPAGTERDADGLEHPDLDAAYLETCRAIPDLVAEFMAAGRDPFACAFVIADAEGRELLTVPFDELAGRRRRWAPLVSEAVAKAERACNLVADVREQQLALAHTIAGMWALLGKAGE